MKNKYWLLGVAMSLPLVISPAIADAAETNPLAEKVAKTLERFLDVKVAVAEGYAATACADGRAGGSMGVHYINSDYLTKDNDAIDLARPEALMYEPMADGTLKLIAVEYVTFKGPATLEGHLFNYTGKPNRYGLPGFYEMHVWAWKENPKGTFADVNPTVSCDAMPLQSK